MCAAADDLDAGGVEQQGAEHAFRRRQIDIAYVFEVLVAGNFRVRAVTAGRAAFT